MAKPGLPLATRMASAGQFRTLNRLRAEALAGIDASEAVT